MVLTRRLIGGSGSSFTAPPAYTTVTQSGVRQDVRTGTSYKAFPGMCIASGGRWHGVYRTGSAHNNAGGTIDYIYSDDSGANWNPAGSATTLYTAPAPSDARDPFIMQTTSGRLLVGYDHRSPYDAAAFSAWLIYSDNGGSTWSAEYEIVSATFDYTIVSSQAIQVPNGDILIPGFCLDSGGPYKAVVWRSTNNGATVASETVIASAANDFEETQIRALASGRTVALMRDTAGGVIWRSVSSDYGVTWSSPTSVLTANGRPDFVEISPGLLFMQLRNNDSNSYARFTYSTDEGLTWATLQNVDSASDVLEYSAPVVTSSGNVAVLYSLENSGTDADLYLRRYVAA